jgi:hypothetical protein
MADRNYERDVDFERRRDYEYGRGGRYGEPGGREERFGGSYGRQGYGGRGGEEAPGLYGREGYGSYERESSGRGAGQYGGYSSGYGREGEYGQGGQFGQAGRAYTEHWEMAGPFTGRGPRGYQRSDDRIREDVCERLTQHGQIDASDIEVQVDSGVVTLTGTVDQRKTKRMAEDLVESVSGVKDVHNQIRVQQGQFGQTGTMGQTGGLAGGTIPWSDASAGWRQNWEQRQGASGGQRWEEVEPGYRYGHEMAGEPRYRGRRWEEVEPEFRAGYSDWARRQGYHSDDDAWDRLRHQVREGWERVTRSVSH